MLSNSDSCFNEALIIDCEWYTFPATSLPGLQDKPRRPQSEVVFARGLDEVWIGGLHQAALLWTCSVMLIYADDASLLELGSSMRQMLFLALSFLLWYKFPCVTMFSTCFYLILSAPSQVERRSCGAKSSLVRCSGQWRCMDQSQVKLEPQ